LAGASLSSVIVAGRAQNRKRAGQIRAIQALELIATPEARALLETLAKGGLGSRQTREASESLDRLAKWTIR